MRLRAILLAGAVGHCWALVTTGTFWSETLEPEGVHPAPPCPGNCSGHGSCDYRRGFCWCDPGFTSQDCSKESTEYIKLNSVANPTFQEAIGTYKVENMYLSEDAGMVNELKFIHYERATSGWVLSQFESPCPDDVCFFAYQRERELPPKSGYVYGAPDFQMYTCDMVIDDADRDCNITRGYHLSVEYTKSPNERTGLPNMAGLNGRYVLQPRYVHQATGKYMIMPIDYQINRTWILAGLVGVPRKWRILAKSSAPAFDINTPPTVREGQAWEPQADGFDVERICTNVIPDVACGPMAHHCPGTDIGFEWVPQCCRSTCHTCTFSRTVCPIKQPKVASLLEQYANHSANPGDSGDITASPRSRRFLRHSTALA